MGDAEAARRARLNPRLLEPALRLLLLAVDRCGGEKYDQLHVRLRIS